MNSSCIVTQVHIPPFDIQGSLNEDEKKRLVELSLTHLRRNNPDACIIFSWHGAEPTKKSLDVCDVTIGAPLAPLDRNGYVAGMPAQYRFVSAGIRAAKHLGYSRVVKTRGDCLIGIPNIAEHCEAILSEEGRRILVTQQTGNDFRLGDCFMYGDTTLIDGTWDADHPVQSPDGLIHTGINFYNTLGVNVAWGTAVRSVAAFRDVHRLKFACLRWNYRRLANDWDKVVCDVMLNSFDFVGHHWGKTNGWHGFDANDNMIVNCNSAFWSEKDFYEC